MTRKKERVHVIIDGSNFYHRLKELFPRKKDLISFDYKAFAQYLGKGKKVVQRTYYVGVVRAKLGDKKGQGLRKGQQRLFAKLKNDDWDVSRGFILKYDDRYHEKGVDVHMAVDILIGAYENLYDTVILVSSDTDLIPALKKVRQMKKEVYYIGFGHKPSFGLIAHSDVRRLLSKEDMQQFLV